MPFIKKGELIVGKAEIIPGSLPALASEFPGTLPEVWAGTKSKGRDFDAEARGKTRCALEEAWAQSPLLPMLIQDPSDRAALHALLDELVTERMKRVFPNG